MFARRCGSSYFQRAPPQNFQGWEMLEAVCVLLFPPDSTDKESPDATLILRARKRLLAPPFTRVGKLIVETPTIVHYAIVLNPHHFSR